MKSRSNICIALCCLCFFMGAAKLTAQRDSVPDSPRAVRVLPTSFKDAYGGAAYDYVESVSFWERLRLWVIQRLVSWLNIQDTGAARVLEVLELLFYILVILVALYVIVKSIWNKDIAWLFRRKAQGLVGSGLELGDNIQEVDFDALIQKALQDNDYRSAIRYHYLALLKKLDRYGVVAYDDQKTTYDYRLQLQGSKYAEGFDRAAYYYTYVWYGEFAIDKGGYTAISDVYVQLLKQFVDA